MNYKFSTKPRVWQTIGTSVSGLQTREEAIQRAGLNFEVEKRPLFTRGSELVLSPEGLLTNRPQLDVPNHYATVRTDSDTVLGVVGNEYQIVQNSEVYDFVDAVANQGKGVEYDTAGIMGNGERIFITAKMPDIIRIGTTDDVIENFLFFTNAHFGKSLRVGLLPNRLFCANQFNHALRTMTNSITIKHTASAHERLKQAIKILRTFNQTSLDLGGLYNSWAKIRITDAQVKRLIQLAMCPNKETLELIKAGRDSDFSTQFTNVIEDAFAYSMEADSQQLETTKGTLFGAYNGVTGYFQNVKEYKSPQLKMKSLLLDGDGFTKSQHAFDLCNEFSKFGADSLFLN